MTDVIAATVTVDTSVVDASVVVGEVISATATVAGTRGPAGPAGPTGPGVPDGGTTSQVLAKTSDADQDTEWVDAGSGSGTVDSVAGVDPVAGDVPVASLVAALESGGLAAAADLSSEATARIAADTALASSVTAETSRAEGVEALKANSADLAAVATSGVYSDLTGRPTLGTAAAAATTDFDAAGAASTAQAAAIAAAASDATTKANAAVTTAEAYTDVETTRAEAAEALKLALAGGTMSGAIAMGSHKITGLTNGSAGQDAAAFGQIPTALPPNGSAGGDLTGTYPNPTLAVDRITKALLTTKGDTIAASGASTPVRVGVGADGTVFTADAASPGGVKWAAAAGGGGPVAIPVRVISGLALPLTQCPSQSFTNQLIFSGAALGRGAAIPFAFDATTTPTSFAVNVTTLASSSFLLLAIYADNGSGKPGALVNDYGQVSSATTGVKTWSNSNQFTANTRYWYLIVVQGAGNGTVQVTSQQGAAGVDIGDPVVATALTNNREGYDISGVTGAAPSNIASLATAGGVNSHVRVVAVFP